LAITQTGIADMRLLEAAVGCSFQHERADNVTNHHSRWGI
jgi:hypothetical protein